MELKMDPQELAQSIGSRRVASAEVFGAAALVPAGCADQVAHSAAPARIALSPAQQRLLTAAYGQLLEANAFPEVLDLLGGSDDFVPPGTGLAGPEPEPGQSTADFSQKVARFLSEQPQLPFDSVSFDAALLTLEVGSLRRPLEVFRDLARVLRPRGLVAVTFREARYDGAHTKLWAHGDDREHLMLAEAFIAFAGGGFSRPTSLTLFEAARGIEWQEGTQSLADSEVERIHLVFAYRGAVAPAHLARKPFPPPAPQARKTKEDVRFDETGRPYCPYCGERMGRYAPPVTVFEIDYGVDELYVCFDDRCDYYQRSKAWMRSQGHVGYTYRFMLNPKTGQTGPLPDSLSGGLQSCRLD